MKWLQTSGNFFTVDKNTIKYNPAEDLSGFGHSDNIRGKFTGWIKSTHFFESGTISFKLNLHNDNEAFFNVILSEANLQFTLNSALAKKAFSIKGSKVNDKPNIFSQNVDKESIKKNYDYHIEISVNGSIAKLLVDGVLICSSNIPSISREQLSLVARSRSEVTIKDFEIKTEKPKVFVVMQFSEEYDHLYKEVIKVVCEDFGYECFRGDEYFTNGTILKDITDAINESSIIIADITPNNPNVFYEVGYSHALGKPTILLSDKKREKLPFDVSGFRTLFYDNTIAGKSEVEHRLRKHLENIQSN